MPASSLTTSSPRVSERRVKHLRLFGSRLNSDCVASRWLLRQSGHDDDVEHVEVNVITSEHMTEAFSGRNRFQSLPYLEVIFDRCGAVPSGTTKVSDLAPWKDEAPCTTHTATGETIAEPDDRVFSLTEGGAVCMFFAEHFKLTNIWDPRRVLQRLRSVEISGHAELLARRIMSMVLIIVSSRTAGATTSDIVTGVAAHEPELLWTFRIMEDMLTRSEEAAAHAAGLDYQELLAVGESEVSDIEASESQPPAHVDKQGPRDTRHHRFPTSPTLVALDAYIGGRSLSIADFLVTSDLQVYPYIQSWLPNSLKQPRFPALLRYLERMRNVHGFEHALLPRLSFHNVFRRRPKVMASNQLLYVFAERLKKMIDRGNGSTTTSSPSAEDAPMTGNAESDGTLQEETATPQPTKTKTAAASALKERLGRVRAWAPKLSGHAPPLPCTLCDEDERALQASQSHRRAITVTGQIGTASTLTIRNLHYRTHSWGVGQDHYSFLKVEEGTGSGVNITFGPNVRVTVDRSSSVYSSKYSFLDFDDDVGDKLAVRSEGVTFAHIGRWISDKFSIFNFDGASFDSGHSMALSMVDSSFSAKADNTAFAVSLSNSGNSKLYAGSAVLFQNCSFDLESNRNIALVSLGFGMERGSQIVIKDVSTSFKGQSYTSSLVYAQGKLAGAVSVYGGRHVLTAEAPVALLLKWSGEWGDTFTFNCTGVTTELTATSSSVVGVLFLNSDRGVIETLNVNVFRSKVLLKIGRTPDNLWPGVIATRPTQLKEAHYNIGDTEVNAEYIGSSVSRVAVLTAPSAVTRPSTVRMARVFLNLAPAEGTHVRAPLSSPLMTYCMFKNWAKGPRYYAVPSVGFKHQYEPGCGIVPLPTATATATASSSSEQTGTESVSQTVSTTKTITGSVSTSSTAVGSASVSRAATASPTVSSALSATATDANSSDSTSGTFTRTTVSETLSRSSTWTKTHSHSSATTFSPSSERSMTVSPTISRSLPPAAASPTHAHTPTAPRTSHTTTDSRSISVSNALPSTASAVSTLSRQRTATPELPTPAPVVAVPALPKTVAAVATATVATGSSVAAFAGAGAAGAAQAGRTLAVMQLAECAGGNDDDGPTAGKAGGAKAAAVEPGEPPFPQSLLPWVRVGSGQAGWDRGTIIGNGAAVAGMASLATAVWLAVFHLMDRGVGPFRTLAVVGNAPDAANAAGIRASRLLRYPGAAVAVPCGLAVDGVVGAAVALLRGTGTGRLPVADTVIAVVALAVVVALYAAVLVVTLVVVPRMVEVQPAPHVEKAAALAPPDCAADGEAATPRDQTMKYRLQTLRDGTVVWAVTAPSHPPRRDEDPLLFDVGAAPSPDLDDPLLNDGAVAIPAAENDRHIRTSKGTSASSSTLARVPLLRYAVEAATTAVERHTFLARWAALFGAYRPFCRWFLVADAAASIAIAAIRGARPKTTDGCRTALFTVTAVQLAVAVAAVALRPYVSPLRSVTFAVSSALLATAACVGAVAALHGSSATGAEAASALAVVAGAVLLANPALAVWRLLDTRFGKARKRGSSSSDSAPDDPLGPLGGMDPMDLIELQAVAYGTAPPLDPPPPELTADSDDSEEGRHLAAVRQRALPTPQQTVSAGQVPAACPSPPDTPSIDPDPACAASPDETVDLDELEQFLDYTGDLACERSPASPSHLQLSFDDLNLGAAMAEVPPDVLQAQPPCPEEAIDFALMTPEEVQERAAKVEEARQAIILKEELEAMLGKRRGSVEDVAGCR